MDLLSATKEELKALIYSMLQEEILDFQFQQILDLQDESNPNLVAEVITLFLTSADTNINLMGQYMSQNDVKFPEMCHQVHQIKGSSSSIGAKKINLASVHLREAIEAKNKEMCLVALNQMRREYVIVREKFTKVVQLENKIFAIKSNQNFHP